MQMDLLQYPGVALGLIGAVLVSQRSPRARRSGFLLWIGSNVLLISWAVSAAAWGLLAIRRLLGDRRDGVAEQPHASAGPNLISCIKTETDISYRSYRLFLCAEIRRQSL